MEMHQWRQTDREHLTVKTTLYTQSAYHEVQILVR